MGVYVVTWNLNRERANYATARAEFIKYLERHQNIGESGLESVRWIHSNLTAQQLYTDLRTKLDDNDRIFVSKLASGTYAGWLNQTTVDWFTPKV